MLLTMALIAVCAGLMLVLTAFVKRRLVGPRNGLGHTVPGPTGFPVIRQSFSLDIEKAYIHFTEWQKKYGDIYSISLFGNNVVVLGSLEYVKKAFAGEQYCQYMNDRPPSFLGHYIADEYKDILLRYNDEKFGKIKNICMSALHTVGNGCPSRCDAVALELQHVISKFDDSQEANINPMDVINLSLCNMAAILYTGKRYGETDPMFQCIFEFEVWGNKIIQPKIHAVLKAFPFLRHLPGKYKEIYQHLINAKNELSQRVISEMKKSYKPEKQDCLVHAIMKAVDEERKSGNRWLDDGYILGILMDLINTGGLTCRGVISGFILLLAHHQNIQEKVREEIARVIGLSRTPNADDLHEMPYTHACILECLRHQSHLPLTAGHANSTSDVTFEGYFIPKGTVIYANLWSIHHDSKLWNDPWTYIPERFLNRFGQLLSPNHYVRKRLIPFGVGKRCCVGRYMAVNRTFLYLCSILQHFQILPPEGTILPSQDPRHLATGIVLQAPDFKCRFVPVRTFDS